MIKNNLLETLKINKYKYEIYLKEIGCWDVNWIDLILDGAQWRKLRCKQILT